ncbi:MAG: hypothetical protein P9M14_16430, partial [Candidatus Alcyoniella australis]|nr:hypothetical protein [Candidatus Alcyoniella australis]
GRMWIAISRLYGNIEAYLYNHPRDVTLSARHKCLIEYLYFSFLFSGIGGGGGFRPASGGFFTGWFGGFLPLMTDVIAFVVLDSFITFLLSSN